MERNVFMGRALASAAAFMSLRDLVWDGSVKSKAPFNLHRNARKYRPEPYAGACRVTIWSGIKKRMRAARRGLPLGPM